MQYTVIIEKGSTSFGAYVRDLPGCVAVADTREEVKRLIQEAIGLHLRDLKEAGSTVPEPVSSGELIEVAAC